MTPKPSTMSPRRNTGQALDKTYRRNNFDDPTATKDAEINEPYQPPNTTRPMVLMSKPETLEMLQRRDAPAPPPGYRYTLDGKLVPFLETKLPVESREAQAVFCEVLERTGSSRAAADALGISLAVAKRYFLKDLDFAEAAEAAADRHRQTLYAAAVQRATVGVMVPIIGGKDKDQIVAYECRTSDSLLALLLKRHFPEFRTESKSLTINNQPTVNLNIKEMDKGKRDQLRKLLEDSPKVIDTTATETEDSSGIGGSSFIPLTDK